VLLGAYYKRLGCRRAASKCDELAPPHSITSSAMASSDDSAFKPNQRLRQFGDVDRNPSRVILAALDPRRSFHRRLCKRGRGASLFRVGTLEFVTQNPSLFTAASHCSRVM
jgi:hypothetical protein